MAALHIDATPINGPVVHHSAGLNFYSNRGDSGREAGSGSLGWLRKHRQWRVAFAGLDRSRDLV
jgi:hypothetical protein